MTWSRAANKYNKWKLRRFLIDRHCQSSSLCIVENVRMKSTPDHTTIPAKAPIFLSLTTHSLSGDLKHFIIESSTHDKLIS